MRNAEIKQFVYNIIRNNEKENLDAELFLQTAFGEWFSGKKENISKNYNVLPKGFVSVQGRDGIRFGPIANNSQICLFLLVQKQLILIWKNGSYKIDIVKINIFGPFNRQ